MPPEIDVNKSINSKLSNDKISQLMAPIITSVSSGYVLISRSWEHSSLIPFIILFTLTILQAIFLVLPQTKNNKFFASGGPFPLGIYNAAIIIMFVFYLPIYSPLVIIIPILTFITVYYRGLRIMAFSIFVLILTVVLSYLRNGLPDAPYANYYPYILIILSISLTILVQRAGIIDNKIRQELINKF